jgi:pteridine reductase
VKLRHGVALVTGGARRLGLAIARSIAARGANVVVHFGHSRAAAAEACRDLASLGVEAWPVAADLADPAAIDGLFTEVERLAGRLDLLVNSAASFESAPFESITAADWDRVLALNLRAPFLCMQRAAELMGRSTRPPEETAAVVNVADWSGLQPWPGFAHHGASKAALLHLTRIAARELAPAVRVNAVVPGAILPPAGVEPEAESWTGRAAAIPRGRTGRPQEVGSAVVFLAEHEFLTGVALPIDGGESLR